MTTLLKTTVDYDSDSPYLSLDVHSNGIESVAIEKRYASWYATLDYTDSDGMPKSITPYSWTRYRNIYTLEYETETCYFALSIKEHSDNAKLTVYLGMQNRYDDGNHDEAIA